MGEKIQSVAIIGAGVMGASIAGHIASAGFPVLLLDLVKADTADRNSMAKTAIDRLKTAQPSPLMSQGAARLITPGNIEDDLWKVAEYDWILEAVTEQLSVKKPLYDRIAKVRKPRSIVSSNTSTIPLSHLLLDVPSTLKPDFLITHFFNPPRYMRLLELVVSAHTRLEAVFRISEFCDVALGKTVIHCKDTPGFIANRIGAYWLQTAAAFALHYGLRVEEADKIMGKPFGFPSTGIFGLMDLVGLDITTQVNDSLARLLPPVDAFHEVNRELPIIRNLIAGGYLGKKGTGGFYRTRETSSGALTETLCLTAASAGDLEWRPISAPQHLRILESGQDIKDLLDAESVYSQFAWAVLGRLLAYSASLIGEISSDIATVDEAMRFGYAWAYGPFELIDRLGGTYVRKRLADLTLPVPKILADVGEGKFYKENNGTLLYFGLDGTYHPVIRPPGVLLLQDIKLGKIPLLTNESASVWDVGDGVLCFELHSPMNALDEDTLDLLEQAIGLASKGHVAMVIYAEDLRASPGHENFSVGANLGLAMFAANICMWSKIEQLVAKGQRIYQLVRAAPFPVIGAPAGRALGGGCEMLLHCTAVQAHAESYIGLVEASVGLVPAWGGCAELLARWQADNKMPHGPMPAVTRAFQIISTAKISRSAEEARDQKFLQEHDGITMNRHRVLNDAKAHALRLAPNYEPPSPSQPLQLPGRSGWISLTMAVEDLRKKGIATAHDVTVLDHLAWVLTGGDTDLIEPAAQSVILDLEHQTFMELIRLKETQSRIKHVLDTGKPLRN